MLTNMTCSPCSPDTPLDYGILDLIDGMLPSSTFSSDDSQAHAMVGQTDGCFSNSDQGLYAVPNADMFPTLNNISAAHGYARPSSCSSDLVEHPQYLQPNQIQHLYALMTQHPSSEFTASTSTSLQMPPHAVASMTETSSHAYNQYGHLPNVSLDHQSNFDMTCIPFQQSTNSSFSQIVSPPTPPTTPYAQQFVTKYQGTSEQASTMINMQQLLQYPHQAQVNAAPPALFQSQAPSQHYSASQANMRQCPAQANRPILRRDRRATMTYPSSACPVSRPRASSLNSLPAQEVDACTSIASSLVIATSSDATYDGSGSDDNSPPNNGKLFTCARCAKSFKRKADCIRHGRIHTGEKPYKCAGCGEAFARQDALRRHQSKGSAKCAVTATRTLRGAVNSISQSPEAAQLVRGAHVALSSVVASDAHRQQDRPYTNGYLPNHGGCVVSMLSNAADAVCAQTTS